MEIGQYPGSSCSKEHQKIYQEWFALTGADGDGRITGPDAIKFFGMSKLSRPDLKQVWAIADTRRQGYLGFPEFVTAMQVKSPTIWPGKVYKKSLWRKFLDRIEKYSGNYTTVNPHVGYQTVHMSGVIKHYNLIEMVTGQVEFGLNALNFCCGYSEFRPVRGDGECFYRSFIFSYLGQVLHRQDTREDTRAGSTSNRLLLSK